MKRIRKYICVCMVVIVAIFCFSHKNTLFLLINWRIEIGISDIVYQNEKSNIRYIVGEVPFYEEYLIKNQLIEQRISELWKKEIRDNLSEMQTDTIEYPVFENIDYSIKKTNHLSYVYILYSSDSSIVYILESID